MTIREMEVNDANTLAALEQQYFSDPWTAEGYLDSIGRPGILYLVAEEDGSVVGEVGLRAVLDEGEITNVCVSKEYRGRHIAMELTEELMRRGRAMGVSSFTLEVRAGNAPAIALYERLGFLREGIRPRFYTNPTEDALIYWKREESEC